MRATRSVVESAFRSFCESRGLPVATNTRDEGAYALNHSSVYGGYVVVRYGKNGSEWRPFGEARKAPRAMLEFLTSAA